MARSAGGISATVLMVIAVQLGGIGYGVRAPFDGA